MGQTANGKSKHQMSMHDKKHSSLLPPMKELLGGRLPKPLTPSMKVHSFEAKPDQMKVRGHDVDEDSFDSAR